MTDILTFTDQAVQNCPVAAYESLRDDQPVFKDPVTGHYILTRYEDVRRALLNHASLSNKTGFLGDRWSAEANALFKERGWMPMDTLVSNDPPDHRRFRTLVDKVFTTTKVASLEPRINEIIAELIDAFPDDGEIDFLQAFAIPLPMFVIAEQLGVPREHRHRFKDWSDAAVESTSPTLTPEREMELAHIMIDMQRYMANEIERVRAEPNDMLLSRLVNFESEGRQLTVAELQNVVRQILVAGNETTTTTLASGMQALIEQPALVEQLRDDSARARGLAEEILRRATPLQTLFRRAKEPLTIAGTDIPEGAIVEVRYGAGNHDPRQFACPADIDLDRKNSASHLAFGAGIHLCVGNQLARGELRLAFEALTRRLVNFRYSRGERSAVPVRGYITYGSSELWMTFDRR